MRKVRRSLKNRGLVHSIQPEPDFSWTYGFRKELNDVELITYMKFQNIFMIGCRDMGKELQNYSYTGVFPPFVIPKIFFKNRAPPLVYPYEALTS